MLDIPFGRNSTTVVKQFCKRLAIFLLIDLFLKSAFWPFSCGLRGHRRTYLTILKRAWYANFTDTGRIYIKGYLYPILYPNISKKDISYPFLEQDILRI
jgi:hypothetical protein